MSDLRGAKDPGPRDGAGFAGAARDGLTAEQIEMFNVGLEDFSEAEEVGEGLGPRFNFVGCAGCHAHPAIGGTSPAANPLYRVVSDLGFGRNNIIPSFITRTVRSGRRGSGTTRPAPAMAVSMFSS